MVERNVIVAYRAPYINETVGCEENNPIHVADVVKLVDLYISSRNPKVIVSGDSTATTLQSTVSWATEQSSYHRKRGREEDVSKLVDSGSKRTRQGSSCDAKISEFNSNCGPYF